MNIAINQTEQYKETAQVKGSYGSSGGNDKGVKDTASVSGSFRWDGPSSAVGNQAYRETKDKESALLDEASLYDTKNSKDFMVVMSNTLSDEDYKKLQEKGGNPGDYEPGEMVTVIDEIKVTLARAGVHIAGYTDDLDAGALKEAAGNEAYAAAIAHALEAKNLPVTEKNVKDCYNEIEKASHITELSDGAKKYLLENGLEPTIDSLYKASYAGAKNSAAQPSGYFGAGAEGYLAKKGTAEDLSAMEEQIKKVIINAGFEVNEETLGNAHWLLEKGLPLTEESLFRLEQLDTLTFPIKPEEAALAAADAISAGLSAKDADLSVGEGYKEENKGYIWKAREINDKTGELTEDDLMTVIRTGRSLTLFHLFQMKSIMASRGNHEGQTDSGNGEILEPDQNSRFISAKKQLLEIQRHMSAQANLKLMRQGIHIEMEPLNKLLNLLEKEESVFHSTELSDIQEKTEEIKSMPAAAIGVSVQEAWMMKGCFTLDKVYETGKNLAGVYARAGETYEALMTAPRADLGDSIKTAFRNVDELLRENSMEITPDNRRAVRILGYNSMEITEENINAVKEADAMLNKVLSHMTPEKTLHMLREGINPMEMNLDALSDYFSSQKSETEDMEKYSKYLHRLEKNKEISVEEKDAYIGIYRLLRQIEKGDGAAIGAVVSNKQELNLENLLGAVRTRKKGYVDAKIDDAFGLLSDIEKQGDSISDQILNYFKNRAGNLADDLGGGDPEADGDFIFEDLEQFRSTGMVSEEHFNALMENNIPVTPNNLLAEEALASKGSLFKDLLGLSRSGNREKDFRKKMENVKESMSEGREAVKEAYEELAGEAKEILSSQAEESGSYIDVRSMALYTRQVELLSRHANEENYYVPVRMENEWTMLHVQIVNGKGQGKVSIDYKGTENGKVGASFVVAEGRVEGLIALSDFKDLEKYNAIAGKCAEEILAKTGKEADITCVQSKTLNIDAFIMAGSEEKQTSTGLLYQVAKAFIHTMEQEVTGNENQL